MQEKQLYTTQEVAEQLSVTDSYIRKLMTAGKAQAVKQIGGTWMFTFEEIERLRHRPKSKGGRPKKS